MVQEVARPESFFFDRFGVTPRALEAVLGSALERKADYADLYFEYRTAETLGIEDSLVSRAARHTDCGVGVRVCAEERTGYAHSDEITVERMRLAVRTARAIADGTGRAPVPVKLGQSVRGHDLYNVSETLGAVGPEERARLLAEVDRAARQFDPRVKNVIATLSGEQRVVMVVTSDGRIAADIRPLWRLSVSVVAQDAHGRQVGTSGTGGRVDYSFFGENERWREHALLAARQAVIGLEADEAPAGEMVVVLGPGWPGIILHEAVGHGLEGDFNRKGVSAFAGRLGQRVASAACTVVDDGTLAGRRGSLNIDDEGTPTGRTVLIDRGILSGYLQDRLNARLMKMAPTGNGRRESYCYPPMPRMTNTFLLPGEFTPEEIIRSVAKGVYAVSFSGGQVDITSGKFVFSASEAYLIENGSVTRPIKGATLIGSGPEVLTRVTMVGNDLALDPGIGTCGKEGQWVPVGVGLPTVRVDGITVGGTRT